MTSDESLAERTMKNAIDMVSGGAAALELGLAATLIAFSVANCTYKAVEETQQAQDQFRHEIANVSTQGHEDLTSQPWREYIAKGTQYHNARVAGANALRDSMAAPTLALYGTGCATGTLGGLSLVVGGIYGLVALRRREEESMPLRHGEKGIWM